MCMGGSSPKAQPIPAVLPEAPQASGRVEVSKDADKERRKRAGQAGTILTGARGLTAEAGGSNAKTLLGG